MKTLMIYKCYYFIWSFYVDIILSSLMLPLSILTEIPWGRYFPPIALEVAIGKATSSANSVLQTLAPKPLCLTILPFAHPELPWLCCNTSPKADFWAEKLNIHATVFPWHPIRIPFIMANTTTHKINFFFYAGCLDVV